MQIITRMNVGGPARHVLVTTSTLPALGFTTLLVYGAQASCEGSLEPLIGQTDVSAVKLSSLARGIRPWKDLHAFYRLVRLMLRTQPDIVHTHTAKAGTLGRLAACVYNLTRRRRDRAVIIHTFHGHVFNGYFGPVASAAVRFIERGMARVTDCIVTVSARQKTDICGRYGIADTRKTEVLDLGTDLQPLLQLVSNTSLRDELGFTPRHIVFGYVGRFVPIKNLPKLIHAFANLATRCDDARLMLVGDGEVRGEIERLTDQLQLGDRIRMTGWLRDMPAVYGAMDVAVLTSINEGTPLALIEAMAAGRPVISTAVGGVEDVVSHGRSGLVVPPDDARGVAEAMARLAADAGLRRAMGATARRDVAARLGQQSGASEVGALYRRVRAARSVREAVR